MKNTFVQRGGKKNGCTIKCRKPARVWWYIRFFTPTPLKTKMVVSDVTFCASADNRITKIFKPFSKVAFLPVLWGGCKPNEPENQLFFTDLCLFITKILL